MPRIAIQIALYKSSKDLPIVLQSLKDQSFTDWKVLAMENSCDQQEAQRAKDILEKSGVPFELVISDTNKGFSAHNDLYRMSDAEYVLVLNDDAYLERDFLQTLIARMEKNPMCGTVGGVIFRWTTQDEQRQVLSDETQVDTMGLQYNYLANTVDLNAGKTYAEVKDQLKEAKQLFGISGAIALYRRAAIESVSAESYLYDPTFFMYKEDVELAIRLKRKGWSAWFEPKAIAFHRRAIKAEAKTVFDRLREERKRPAHLRVCTFRNQWMVNIMHANSALGGMDWIRSIIHQTLYQMFVFLASPKVFFQASWKTLQSIPYALKRRRQFKKMLHSDPSHLEKGSAGEESGRHNQTQDALPKIGIIYLTYPTANWERDINRCLASMEKLNYPKDRLELICVESKGKIAPVKDWFEKTWMPKSGKELPRISYIFNDAWIGFAGNNNLGLEKARQLDCEFVHLTNEDTDVDPDYLIRAVERMQADPTIAQVQSLILLGEERDKVNSVGNALHYLGHGYSLGYKWTKEQALKFYEQERKTNPDLEIGYASGAGVLCRIKAIDEVGFLFDEKFFMYHEDTDASLQARMLGWKIVVEPSSIIYHYYEFAKAKINYYWMDRNRHILMFSFYRAWTLFLLVPMIAVMDVATLFFSIKNGWFDMKWKMYKDFFSKDVWKWILHRRKMIQTKRKVSDRYFLKSVVTTIDFQEDSVKNPILTYIGNPLLKGYWWIIKKLIF